MSIVEPYKVIVFIAGLIFINTSLAEQYAGSESCFACHAQQYNDFRLSGHPHKLMKAEQARHRPVPLPAGYTWDDISYVIGGVHKKIRYIDKHGYIITAAKNGGELKTQYNLETGTWSFYSKGSKKPYTCGECHTTGFNPSGHQGGLEGIKGTWVAPGIQCEACHGPGLLHTRTSDKKDIKIDLSAAACGKCHVRGKPDTIPAKGGFISHHEQFNELLAGQHKVLTCVSCHNPHKKSKFSIKKECSRCHYQQLQDYKGSTMHKLGVTCIDCHMPKAVKSATHKSSVEADVRSHLFKIAITEQSMFYDKQVNGETRSFARNFVSTNFACLFCHKDKDSEWARQKAKNVHRAGK